MNTLSVEKSCSLAKENISKIAYMTEEAMNDMLKISADSLIVNCQDILNENKKDLELSSDKPTQFLDRLALSEDRIKGIANGLLKITQIKTPVGEILDKCELENGLKLTKIRVPFGVIGIIYEARPNVTADAIGLAIKSGNAIVLRGSKDAINSNKAITLSIKNALKAKGYDGEFIQLIEDTSREGATTFMKMKDYVDVLIPRGGAGLIKNAVENSLIPVIETGTGNCHLYVEETADFDMALKILINGKTQRPSVCNALESLLIDEKIAKDFLPKAVKELRKYKVDIIGCEKSVLIDNSIMKAFEEDFYTEYLGYSISVKIVKNVDEAILHINKYGTHHSDSIISNNAEAVQKFMLEIDSSVVYHNASTRFTDGFEFGFGAEMGISTQKLHARGPMGLKELTSYKYLVEGSGQIRK